MALSADNIGRCIHAALVNSGYLSPGDSIRVVIGGHESGGLMVRVVLPPLNRFERMGCMKVEAIMSAEQYATANLGTEVQLISEIAESISAKINHQMNAN